MDPTQDPKGFLQRLFDLSLTSYVTTKILKVIYIVAIVLAGLGALSMIVSGFRVGAGAGLLALIVSPILFLIYVILARVWVELVIVLFRIADDISTLVRLQGGTPAAGPAGGSAEDEPETGGGMAEN